MKKKKLSNIIVLAVSFVISMLLGWYILNSILFGIAYGICVILFAMRLIKQYGKMAILYKHIDASYNFVNLMNLQMLSSNSVYEAYKSIETYVDVDFANMAVDDIQVQLLEIANDYNLNAFKMYVKTLMIFDSNGGNFKEMEEIPTSLCQKTKVYYNQLKTHKFAKLAEISTLYLLWLFILIFIKISIPEYYATMMESATYELIMFCVLIVGTGLFYMGCKDYFKNRIRGL